MKNWIIAMLSFSLLLSGCARIKKWNLNSPVEKSATSVPVVERAEEMQPESLPDFVSMTFVEKNSLYMQLLNENLDAGIDTLAAENAYQRSLEASLSGDSGKADQALEEAILILLDQ
jgi:hypothetical protein